MSGRTLPGPCHFQSGLEEQSPSSPPPWAEGKRRPWRLGKRWWGLVPAEAAEEPRQRLSTKAEALAKTFTLGQADSEADHRAGAFYRACSEGSHPQGLLWGREGGLGSPEPSVTPSVGLELSSLLFLQSPS